MAALEVVLSLIDEFTGGIDSASESVGNLEGSVNSASSAIDSIEWSTLEDVSSAAEDAGTSLSTASNEATDLGTSLAGIDPSTLNDTAAAADEAGASTDGMAESAGVLEGALGALMGIGIIEFFDQIASSAGNVVSSLDAMSINFNLDDSGIINATNSISQLNSQTGVAKGSIRDFDNRLGMIGVTSVDVANNLMGVAAQLSYLKYGTNDAAESISSMFANAITSGKMMDRTFASNGISLDQMAARAGMTKEKMKELFLAMTPDERANFLTKFAIDAADAQRASEGLKNSFDTLKDKFDQSLGRIGTSLGMLILPVLVPALELFADALGQIAGFLDKADPSLKGFIGGVLLAAGAVGLIVAGLSVYNSITTTMAAVTALASLAQTGNTAATAGNTAATSGGVVAKLAAIGAWISETAATVASTIAKGIATAATWAMTAAQWALNIAMSLNPIVIVVILIFILIAALVWLYYNSEQVRAGFNWLWAQLLAFFTWAAGAVMGVYNAFRNAFMQILIFVATLPMRLQMYFNQVVAYIWNFAANAFSSAVSVGSNIVNGIISYVSGLPGAVWNEMMAIGQAILSAGGALYNYAVSVGQQIYNGILAGLGISSPGFTYYAVVGELENVQTAIEDSESPLRQSAEGTGTGIYEGFGITGGVNSNNITSSTNKGDYTLNIKFDNVPSSLDEERLAALTIEGIGRNGAMQTKLSELLYNTDTKIKRAWGQ